MNVEELELKLSNQMLEKKAVQHELEEMKTLKSEKEERIHELLDKMKQKERIYNTSNEKRFFMKKQVQDINDIVQAAFAQLDSIRELADSLKQERDTLFAECEKYKSLLGPNVGELTPRPAWKRLMAEKRIELNVKDDPFWKGNLYSNSFDLIGL